VTEQVYRLELPQQVNEAPAAPKVQPKVHPKEDGRGRRVEKTSALARIRTQMGISPGLAVMALAAVAVVMMMLMSHAQLVIVNDDVVSARNQLSELKTEETKLMAQYELAYDLQEIEKKMLNSGEMIRIQSWQTYTLELAEPDSVEYFQSSSLSEKLRALAGSVAAGLQEYF
jgi:hypothetical protein